MTDVKHLRKVADEVQKHFCVPYAQDIDDAADEIEKLLRLLREWQFDVGGASERLERETLAALGSSGHPKTD